MIRSNIIKVMIYLLLKETTLFEKESMIVLNYAINFDLQIQSDESNLNCDIEDYIFVLCLAPLNSHPLLHLYLEAYNQGHP